MAHNVQTAVGSELVVLPEINRVRRAKLNFGVVYAGFPKQVVRGAAHIYAGRRPRL
jgi:hypothetical protein